MFFTLINVNPSSEIYDLNLFFLEIEDRRTISLPSLLIAVTAKNVKLLFTLGWQPCVRRAGVELFSGIYIVPSLS